MRAQTTLAILGMQTGSPAMTRFLLDRASRKVEPGFVKEKAAPFEIAHPDHNRSSVGHRSKTPLRFKQLVLDLLELMNIRTRAEPHRNLALRIAHRMSTTQVPAILAIGTTKTMFDPKWLAAIKRVLPAPHVSFKIIRLYKLCPTPVGHLFDGQAGKIAPLLVKVLYTATGIGCKKFLGHR